MPVFLSLQNPLIVDAGFTNFNSIGEKHKHINDFISIAKKHNKDGLIVKNVKDLGSAVDFLKDGLFATTYIVFKPNQIKSAIGNNGNFDTNNPDIRFAGGGGVGVLGEGIEFYERTYADGSKKRFSIEEYEKNIYPDILYEGGGEINEEEFIIEELDDDYKEVYQIRGFKKIGGDVFFFSRLNIYPLQNVFTIELPNGEEIGRATLNEKENYLINIRINENYRRKGLGVSLYNFIESVTGEKLKPSPDKISNEAKNLWVKRNSDIRFAGGGYVSFKQKYNKKFGYPTSTSHNLEQISKDTRVSLKGLQQIYNKGIGAFKTNPSSVRPTVKSKEQWAMARVYSAVMGGKASKIDSNELKMKTGGEVPDNYIYVVNNFGNGESLNKVFNEWKNIKSEKDHADWSMRVKLLRFGTYGQYDLIYVMEKFDFDKSDKINGILKRDFKKEVKSALEHKFDGCGDVEAGDWDNLEERGAADVTIKLNQFLKENGLNTKVNLSKTSFGRSQYIYATDLTNEFPDESNAVKIRISDHSVSNFDRMFNEIHLDLKDTEYDESLGQYILAKVRLKIGRLRKEYFTHEIVTLPETKRVETTNLTDKDVIISESLTKKGKPLYKVDRTNYKRFNQYTYIPTGKIFETIPVDELEEKKKKERAELAELKERMDSDIEVKDFLRQKYEGGKVVRVLERTYDNLETFKRKHPDYEFIEQRDLGGGTYKYFFMREKDGNNQYSQYDPHYQLWLKENVINKNNEMKNESETFGGGGGVAAKSSHTLNSNKGKIAISLDKKWSDVDILLVPISFIAKCSEFNRRNDPKYSLEDSAKNIESIKKSFVKNGIIEPLIINYIKNESKFLLLEGNHRLNALIELEVPYYPVCVTVIDSWAKGKGKGVKTKVKPYMITEINKSKYLSIDSFDGVPYVNIENNHVDVNETDTLTINVPLLIRLFEYIREDVDNDAQIHFLTENLLKLKDKELSMADYDSIINGIKIKKTAEKILALGGLAEGPPHSEGGIPLVVKSTGQNIEIEGGELVVNKFSSSETEKFKFEGKDLTPCEIVSELNSMDNNGVQIDCNKIVGRFKKED